MTLRLHDDQHCLVGEFGYAMTGGSLPPVVQMPFPTYDDAAAAGSGAAKGNIGREVYVFQISGQLRGVTQVFEVHATPNE